MAVLKNGLRNSGSIFALSLALGLSAAHAGGLPTSGHYVSGHGTINKASQSVTVKQSSTTGIIDWKSFSIGKGNGVTFDNGSGATLNRVTGGNLSTIAGSLHATGSLYLMNNSGVIVSGTGKVVTGGNFVATTGNIASSAFDDGDRRFKPGRGDIINKGTIVSGGSTSLVGRNVADSGSLHASVVDLSVTHKISISGSIAARNSDGRGGTVTARGQTIVIATNGEIDASASAADQKGGTISVVARGTMTVGGTLKADGGSAGGFVETSGEHLHVADGAKISTRATNGKTGTWLIDPQDFTIAASGGDITGATLDENLAGDNVIILSSQGATSGNGDIFVDDSIHWSSSNRLTLDAYRNIVFNAAITISGAGNLVLIDGDQAQNGTGNAADGDLIFNPGGNVAFTDVVSGNTQGSLTINGDSYTLANSISQLAGDIAGNASGDYALANSYNASGTYTSSPIPTTFTGTLEGLGNAISNLTINDTTAGDKVGLFTSIGTGGTVRDLGLAHIHLTAADGSTAGGIAGTNGGTISGSYVTGTVYAGADASFVGGLVGTNSGTLANDYATAAVSIGDASAPEDNGSEVGGLAAANSGTITASYATGSVADTTTSYTTTGGGSAGGDAYLGGFVGYNTGTISNSYATGAVTGEDSDFTGGLVGYASSGTISYSYATGQVIGASGKTGGFAGSGGGTLSYDYATGAVSATGRDVGGFVGENYGSISYAYSTGAVQGGSDAFVGGFAGLNASSSTIDESYSTGAATGGNGATVGGFAGENGNTNGISAFVGDYYNSTANTGLGIGDDEDGSDSDVHGLTIGQMRTASSFSEWTDFGTTGGASGWVIVDQDGSLNNAGGATGGTTPMLLSEYSTAITNAHQLQLMELDPTASYTLANDIDASATGSGGDVWGSQGFIPVGGNGAMEFSGTFDGQSHVVDGLTIVSTTGDDGLFGATNGASVKNLGLTNVSVTGASDSANAAGLIGEANGGTVSNVYVTGQVTGGTSSVVGGIIGYQAGGTVSQSWANATVTVGDTTHNLSEAGEISGLMEGGTIDQSFAGGKVTGSLDSIIGGLAGFITSDATIENSYSMVAVISTGASSAGGIAGYEATVATIENSYAVGIVSGTAADEGGLVGSGGNGGDLVNSYWDTQTTGQSLASGYGAESGATGRTTAQLQSALPSGFGNTVWARGTGLFPYLLWQYPSGTPQAVSGFAYSDHGVMALSAGSVSLLIAGTAMGTTATGANGYYYFLEAPGTISGSPVLTYVPGTGGAALAGNATGTVSGLNIDNDYLNETTAGSSYAALASDLTAAIGGNSAVQTIVSGLGNLAIDATGSSFAIDSAIDLGSGTLILNAAGMVSESGAGVIDAKTLTGSASGSVTLTAANSITDLGAFTAAGFSLKDDHDLTVDGTVNAGSHTVELTTTGSGHDIAVDAKIEAATADLISAATITEDSSGDLDATKLEGSAVSTAELTSAKNTLTDLGAFTAAGFSLKDDHDLTVDGTVNAGSHAVELTTTGSGHDLAVDAKLEAGTIDLVSAATITESSTGDLDATTLEGSSVSTAELTSAKNTITDLGAFTSGITFALTDDHDLTVDGTVNAGSHTVELTTTGSGHDIAVDAKIEAGTADLVSAATITEDSSGDLDATKLTGSAHGAVSLTSAKNTLTDLSTFSTGGNNAFSLTDDHALTTDGTVNAGTAALKLTTTGSGHNLAIDSAITGGTITFATTGEATEDSSGAITASLLNVTADTGIELTSTKNKIKKLGTDKTTSGPNHVTL